MKYNPTLHKLSNGVTVILDPMDIETTCVAVSFKTGSIDEKPNEYGITHFCEHMLCKRTKRFPTSRDIKNFVESNGGYTNAYTSINELRLHGRILGKNIDKLIDVLADELQNSAFSPERIELERIVIQDELARAKDNRDHQQLDLVSRTLLNSELHSFQTLGTVENIKSFSREQLLDWLRKRLSAKNCAIVISGKISNPDAILTQLQERFAFLPAHDVQNATQPMITPAVAHQSTDRTKNVNIFIAVPKRFGIDDKFWIKNISERSFKKFLKEELLEEIRQKHGLVYGLSVLSLWQDGGIHAIETECAPENVATVVKLISQTCARVCNDVPLTDEWLRRDNMRRQLGDADWLDSAKSRQDALVSHYHINGKLYNYVSDVERQNKLTVADIKKHARGFFDAPVSIITDGPDFDGDLAQIWEQNFPGSVVGKTHNPVIKNKQNTGR